jgi:tRNA acetyltransferase TAN1
MSGKAKKEIAYILGLLSDEKPVIRSTVARGIIGVKTQLDSRTVIQGLRTLFNGDPLIFRYTLKWMPVDSWVCSDINSLKEAVAKIRNKIEAGEHWRMTVEKRRYTLYHKIDIIGELAQLINEKVNLENPDKIVRIDIIGKYAGVSVLTPEGIFSISFG